MNHHKKWMKDIELASKVYKNKTEDPSVQYAGKGYVQRNPEDPKEP